MEVSEQQKGLLEAMRTIAQHEAQRNSGPQFQTGVVVEDPAGYKCIVRVNDTEKTCTLPEHLHDWVSKDDIVQICDMYGNGAELIVTGSSGSTRKKTLVVNDEDKDKLTGCVTKFADDSGNLTDNTLTLE